MIRLEPRDDRLHRESTMTFVLQKLLFAVLVLLVCGVCLSASAEAPDSLGVDEGRSARLSDSKNNLHASGARSTENPERRLCPPLDYYHWPFSEASAFNRPIGSDAQYSSPIDPRTTTITTRVRGNINTNNGWGVNLYRSDENDPLLTVEKNHPRIKGGKLPVTLRVPRAADNDNTIDAVITIYDSTVDKAYEFYRWRWMDGTPTAKIARVFDLRGIGHMSPSGPLCKGLVGTSASGIATMGGILRGKDFSWGGPITHALQITFPRHKLSTGVRWPARCRDRTAEENTGNIPYGSLVAIPPVSKGGCDFNTMGLSPAGMKLAMALRNYGGYALERGRGTNIRADQFVKPYRLTLRHDWMKLQKCLRLVLNNHYDQKTSGGGEPLAPNCKANVTGR